MCAGLLSVVPTMYFAINNESQHWKQNEQLQIKAVSHTICKAKREIFVRKHGY